MYIFFQRLQQDRRNLWPYQLYTAFASVNTQKQRILLHCQGRLFGFFNVNLLQQRLISGLLLAMTGTDRYLCMVLWNSPQEPMCSYISRDYYCWDYFRCRGGAHLRRTGYLLIKEQLHTNVDTFSLFLTIVFSGKCVKKNNLESASVCIFRPRLTSELGFADLYRLLWWSDKNLQPRLKPFGSKRLQYYEILNSAILRLYLYA